jgi:hypothetical protein
VLAANMFKLWQKLRENARWQASKSRLRGLFDKAFIALNCAGFALVPACVSSLVLYFFSLLLELVR